MVMTRSLIVAYTIFLASLTSATLLDGINASYQHEQDALMQLRNSVNSGAILLSNWTGPPCFHNVSLWFGVVCSNGHVVQLVLEEAGLGGSLQGSFLQDITFLRVLNFRNNSLTGSLPNLSNLVHLDFVILSNNGFTGYIPIEYIRLPKLKELQLQDNFLTGRIPPFDQPTLASFNVSYNHLRGEIPRTCTLRRFPKSSFDHNSALSRSSLDVPCPISPAVPPERQPALPPERPRHPMHRIERGGLPIWTIVLIAIATGIVWFAAVFAIFYYYRKKHTWETIAGETEDRTAICSSFTESSDENRVDLNFFNKDVPKFDLDDLLRASGEVLGNGNLGTTYKATMDIGSVYTVKGLKMNQLSNKEFVEQMKILAQIRHENLAEMISYHCSKEKLVIYEFVPGTSLFELLHGKKDDERLPLQWTTRLSIIKDTAKGLLFLHQSLPSQKVPHANLKSSNVIISRDNIVKLTDYGFLSLVSTQKMSENLAIGKSPEFLQKKRLTMKTDVYCFGIVLLEIITGRIPGELTYENEEVDGLSEWVQMVVTMDWSTDILDTELLATREFHNEVLKLTEIALECTHLEPEKRPKMSRVLNRIEEIEQERMRLSDSDLQF